MAFPLGLIAVLSLTCGLLFWVMIFIQTYRPFPKMEPGKRLRISIEQATALSLFLVIAVMVSLWLLMKFVIGGPS